MKYILLVFFALLATSTSFSSPVKESEGEIKQVVQASQKSPERQFDASKQWKLLAPLL